MCQARKWHFSIPQLVPSHMCHLSFSSILTLGLDPISTRFAPCVAYMASHKTFTGLDLAATAGGTPTAPDLGATVVERAAPDMTLLRHESRNCGRGSRTKSKKQCCPTRSQYLLFSAGPHQLLRNGADALSAWTSGLVSTLVLD